MKILLYYLITINVVTFATYCIDKVKAKQHRWRVAEATLLLLAAIGGSIGAWAAMYLARHKTQHKKFKYGIPLIIVLQLALAIYVCTKL